MTAVVPTDDWYPLAPVQEAMLLAGLREPGGGRYVQQVVGELHEPLDPEAHRAAWQALARRRAILRTTVRWADVPRPMQRVAPELAVPFAVADWSAHPEAEQERLLGEYLRDDRQRGFPDPAGPLIRAALFRRAAEHWTLVYTFHHLLVDGRSHHRLLAELFEGDTGDDPPYRDYIDWRANHATDADYWRGVVAGFGEPTPRPDAENNGPTQAELALDETTTQMLEMLASQRSTTLNGLVQAAWAAWLGTATGQSAVLFGVVRSGRHWDGRTHPEAVGLFLNTLPVRADLTRTPAALLRQLREQIESLHTREHDALPDVQAVSGIAPDQPLFETAVLFERYELNAWLRQRGPAWQRRTFTLHETAPLPLMLIAQRSQVLRLKLLARPGSAAIADYLRQVASLLRLLPACVDSPLADWTRDVPVVAVAEPATSSPAQLLAVSAREPELAVIWADVLGHDRFERDTSFFAAGGHSLKVAQVVARVRQRWGLMLDIPSFFAHPTVAGLAAHLATLTAEPAVPPIPPRPANCCERAPASLAQRRLWFLDQLHPDAEAYTVGYALHLLGACDEAALRGAVQDLIDRHEILRTTFAEVDGEPVQVIHASMLADWSETTGIDLERGPLVRFRLERSGANRLVIELHHLIIDGWSIGLLFADLAALYAARLQPAPPLAPLAVQYADYAVWQRAAEVDAARLAYWVERLHGAPTTLELPADFARPTGGAFAGAIQRFDLPAASVARLDTLAARSGATRSIALLAAFALLLHRLAGQDDLVVGVPVANRDHPDAERLVGLVVNTLALRIDASGNPSFTALLARTRAAVVAGLAHADVPLDALVQRLAPERDAGRTPLFAALFNYDPGTATALVVPGGTWTPEPVHNDRARFDLSFCVAETPAGVRAYFEYSTSLFHPSTAERFAEMFVRLLDAGLDDPERPVGALPLLCGVEQQQIAAWNATGCDTATDRPFPVLIAEQARRTPDAVAVRAGDTVLTYANLMGRAGAVARELRRRNVGPGAVVAVNLDRDAGLLPALLGVLAIGAAYLPLAADLPAERRAFILADAGAALTLDAAPDGVAPFELAALSGDAVAYLIYTSGSTGQPKGVEVTHTNVSNFLDGMRDLFAESARGRVLALTTISFDIHVLELWLPLIAGGEIVLAPAGLGGDGDGLLRLIAEQRPDLMQATPTTWRIVLAASGDDKPLVPTAITGGEPLAADLAGQLQPRVGVLWNLYGPTETTVWSSAERVEAGPVSIGRPIRNTTLHVLDPYGHDRPINATGELVIGGAGVARGYRNRPELTAERFPTWDLGRGPERVYRTGDIARRWPDGRIECLGRLDQQVKIRGHRIELGEIETALRQHPAIIAAVVVAKPDASGTPGLAAYCVVRTPVTAEALRSQLAMTLPAALLPDRFRFLEQLPTTPSGKIDLHALPALDDPARREATPPRTPTEHAVAAVWADVLNRSNVGVDESFFESGGHSLLAAVLVSRLRQRLGVAVPLGALFAAPTVARLAAHLERGGPLVDARCVVALKATGTKPPAFLFPGIGGHLFTFARFARALDAEQPVYGVKAIGVDGQRRPLDRIEAIAATYLPEIRQVQPHGPYRLCGYSLGGTVAFEVARQLQAAGEEVAALIVFDMLAPGYPRPLPVWRRFWMHLAALARGGADERRRYLRQRAINVRQRWLKRLGFGVLNAPHLQGLVGAPQADLRRVWAALTVAQGRYKPNGRYRGPLTLYKVGDSYNWAATVFDDPTHGWGRWVEGEVRIRDMPGDHLSLFDEARLSELGRRVQADLIPAPPER